MYKNELDETLWLLKGMIMALLLGAVPSGVQPSVRARGCVKAKIVTKTMAKNHP